MISMLLWAWPLHFQCQAPYALLHMHLLAGSQRAMLAQEKSTRVPGIAWTLLPEMRACTLTLCQASIILALDCLRRRRRRRRFTLSIQPAMAYENRCVIHVWASERMANAKAQTEFWSLCHIREHMAQCASSRGTHALAKDSKSKRQKTLQRHSQLKWCTS